MLDKNRLKGLSQSIEGIEFELKRSARKTMCIQVKRDGSVIILAPNKAKNEVIEQFIISKKDWLISASEKVKKRIRLKPEIVEGVKVEIMGQTRTVVQLDINSKKDYLFESNLLSLYSVDGKSFENALVDIVMLYIQEKIAVYSKLLAVKPAKVTIKAQKSRWGSCNAKGEITFNWRLVFAPKEVIDYVIVHELGHMVHMNHSRLFWDTVESILPDYKKRREWLKAEGGFIDWSFNN
ncbi:MAG: hypothetical protein BGO41_04175 [Clostridiales bacterium 38-18]|nr:MAG: hypothetical protein BGO41_04175 [Clostridiales bacterium 38-18]